MTTRALLPLYALLLVLAGCATRISAPMNIGEGVYMVSGSAGIAANTHDVLTDIQRQASDFCASNGSKALEVVKVDTGSPEVLRFPEGRLQFRCVPATAA